MLVQIPTETISTHYELVRTALENSLNPATYASPDTINNCFIALYRGDMTCWALYDQKPESDEILLHGFIFTTPTYDACTGVKNLLIYSVYTFVSVKEFLNSKWVDAMEVLKTYAKRKNYHRIIAYTNVPRVVDIVKMVGGKAEYVFLTLDVED